MNDVKKQFKNDFEKSINVDLDFDPSTLEPNINNNSNKKRSAKIGLIIGFSALATILLVPIAAFAISSIQVDNKVKFTKKNYSFNQIKIAETNTFKKLNDIAYPNGEAPNKATLSNQEANAYNAFADLTYHSLIDTSKKDNMSYSTIGLYSLANEMSGACNNETVKNKLNNLLGLNEQERVSFYKKIMEANSFANEEASIQLKNAAFFTNEFNYSQSFVNYLSKIYCEAYQLNFHTEINKISEWANKSLNQNDFIDSNFLNLDPDTILYLLSTLYFKSGWENKYLDSDNIIEKFYLSNSETVNATYMQHSYLTKQYYDYGSYISFTDYYKNNYASVTYLTPKRIEDNIFTLTKDANIFNEDESKKVSLDNDQYIMVKLKTPKFKTKSDIDFKDCFNNLGLSDIFNDGIDSFHNAFDDEKLIDYSVFVQNIKQRNEVEFNEDGSIVKSVSMASFAKAMAAMPFDSDTLEVSLNQPFIYIIRDINSTPIFVGHVDNPAK